MADLEYYELEGDRLYRVTWTDGSLASVDIRFDDQWLPYRGNADDIAKVICGVRVDAADVPFWKPNA